MGHRFTQINAEKAFYPKFTLEKAGAEIIEQDSFKKAKLFLFI